MKLHIRPLTILLAGVLVVLLAVFFAGYESPHMKLHRLNNKALDLCIKVDRALLSKVETLENRHGVGPHNHEDFGARLGETRARLLSLEDVYRLGLCCKEEGR